MNAPDISTALQERLLSLPQGGVFDITGLDLKSLPTIPYSTLRSGPQFLISDAPEYIPEPECAVLREEVRPGLVRLYVYNCNGWKQGPRRISAVIRNLGDGPLHYRFLKYGWHAPSDEYGQVAKSALAAFMTSGLQETIYTVAESEAAPLDPVMEGAIVDYNELAHGFYEIEIDQPARITVIQTDPGTPSPVAEARLTTVAPNIHPGAGRGLFEGCDIAVAFESGVVLDSSKGPAQLVMANGKPWDPWIPGTDSTTTGPVINHGNYGVMYRATLPYQTPDGRGLAMITWNPLSQEQWCGYMGLAMMVSGGKFPAELVNLPGDRVGLHKSRPNDAILVQIFPPVEPGRTGMIEFVYSPPGACCLPVPFIFVPIDVNIE